VDTQLELQKLVTNDHKEGVAGQGILTISKQKDGQDNLKFGFEMVTININQGQESGLGLDENVSLAVREQQENIDQQHKKSKVPPPRTGRGGVQKLVLNALHKAIKEHGEMRDSAGKRNKSVHVDQWRAAFYATQMDETTAKKDFDRCFQTLQTAEKADVFAPYAWVIYSDDDQNDSDF
jgi:hypothetical protein